MSGISNIDCVSYYFESFGLVSVTQNNRKRPSNVKFHTYPPAIDSCCWHIDVRKSPTGGSIFRTSFWSLGTESTTDIHSLSACRLNSVTSGQKEPTKYYRKYHIILLDLKLILSHSDVYLHTAGSDCKGV